MSDIDEGGELSPEANAFLARHQKTGEPSKAALERVQHKLTAPSVAATHSKVLPLRRKRALLPPEVMAAAAVVTLLLGGQLVYLMFREQPIAALPPEVATKGTSEVQAIAAAWNAGDFAQVQRLASRACASDECRPLAAQLNKMLERVKRVESLSIEEHEELLQFDLKLAAGKDTALSHQLNALPGGLQLPPAEQLVLGEKLFNEAWAEKKAQNFERALVQLEKCVKTAPAYFQCYRLLGSVYASIAMRDQSAPDIERARQMYEKFLELAPPDDAYVPKVTAILEVGRGGGDAPEASPVDLLLRVGQSKVITIAGIERVAVGDPSTVDIKTLGNDQLEVIGVEPGRTTLLVWKKSGERYSQLIEVRGKDGTAPPPEEPTAELEDDEVETVVGNGTSLTLQIGAQRLISFGPQTSRVAVGDPRIAGISMDGSQVRLKGLHEGTTTVLAWLSSGQRKSITLSVVGVGPSRDEAIESSEVSVTVLVGGQGTVTFGSLVVRMAVGDPAIADVSTAGKKLQLKGMHVGQTTVLAWLASGERRSVMVNVVAANRENVSPLFQKAAQARDSGDWTGAVALARQVLQNDPNHPGALELLEQAHLKAREAYLRGYQLHEDSPAEAREQFRYAMSLLLPEDETYQKAKSRLTELP